MKLIKVACPHCGAKLNIQSGQSRTICEYCGQTVMLEREQPDADQMKAMGYEFEQGRMRALHEGGINTELLGKLRRDLWVYGERERLSQEMKKAHRGLNTAKSSQQNSKILLPGYIAVMIFMAVYALSSLAVQDFDVGITLLVITGIGAFCLPVVKMTSEQNKAKANADYANASTRMQTIGAQYEEGMRRLQYSVVPPRFQNPDSINFFCRCVEEGTAVTIPDAIRQYTEHLDRLEEQKFRAEQLKKMEQTNRQLAINTFVTAARGR